MMVSVPFAVERIIGIINTADEFVKELEQWRNGAKTDPETSPRSLALALFAIDEAHDAAEAIKQRLYSIKNAIDKNLLPEALETAGLDMIRVPSVARSFSVRNNLSASMVDKPLAFEWLRGIGQGDIIQETVNAGTLGALCRNLMLEQGVEPPPEAVKLSPYKSISVVKYKPKGDEA